MTIKGSSGAQRVLVTRFKIHNDAGSTSDRCWNSRCIPPSTPQVNPRILAIGGVRELGVDLMEKLTGLPLSTGVKVVTRREEQSFGDVIFAVCANAKDAADALAILSGRLGHTVSYTLDRCKAAEQPRAGPSVPPPHIASVIAQRPADFGTYAQMQSREPDIGYWSGSSNHSLGSGLAQPYASASDSQTSSLSSGFASSFEASHAWNHDSQPQFVAQTSQSTGSMPQALKRYPKQHGHYRCRECGKAFDSLGDRTKHERIHTPQGSWPHDCHQCGKRFSERKDLARHAKSCG